MEERKERIKNLLDLAGQMDAEGADRVKLLATGVSIGREIGLAEAAAKKKEESEKEAG